MLCGEECYCEQTLSQSWILSSSLYHLDSLYSRALLIRVVIRYSINVTNLLACINFYVSAWVGIRHGCSYMVIYNRSFGSTEGKRLHAWIACTPEYFYAIKQSVWVGHIYA